ncbi:proton-conducting transporter membrane subunit [Pseudonocardia alni]|uniref:proton-conducting transporter transmembrane domain-containing protein n=1 Tax=Pseudonocardia alni TaxID=33907 RepID=UPI00386794EE
MSLFCVLAALWLLVPAVAVLANRVGARGGWLAVVVLTALTAVVATGGPGTRTEAVPWIPSLEIALRLRVDGLGWLFALLVLGVGTVVLAYSTSYVTEERAGGFFALMTAFAAAMLTLVLADDLVVLFVAWEVTTLCSYLLILRVGPAGRAPAARTLLVTVAGGLALLGAVCAIVVRTGTTQLSAALADPAWTLDPVFAGAVAVLVAVAAMTKAAQFPFHSWLPDAMVAPAPVSAYLHAAAMVKAGIYLLMRFAGAASASPLWPWLLVTVGVVTALLGGVFALQRSDLKEMLAYSTISQLGLLVAVIGVGTTTALLAASARVVTHALFKSAGFMTVGLVERRAGTRDLRELRGLFRSMPWTATMIALIALSMAGVPVTLGFVSKEYVLDAALSGDGGPALLAAVGLGAAAVLTVAYSARMVFSVLFGSTTALGPPGGARTMAGTVTVTALAGALLGPAVWLLDGALRSSAAAALGVAPAAVPAVSVWHGVTPALVVSAIAIALGTVVAVAHRWVDRALDRALFPVTGVAVVERLRSGVVGLGRATGRPYRGDAPARHLLIPLLHVYATRQPTRSPRPSSCPLPERHTRSGDEHLRLLAKQDAGCRFFITQVVYDVERGQERCLRSGLGRAGSAGRHGRVQTWRPRPLRTVDLGQRADAHSSPSEGLRRRHGWGIYRFTARPPPVSVRVSAARGRRRRPWTADGQPSSWRIRPISAC